MESEKVKEIKKVLEMFAIDNKEMTLFQSPVPQGESCVKTIKYADILTLINELESENKNLKWEKQILENKDVLLAKLGEMVQENQKLKDRIAELKKELNEEKMCSFNRSTIIMLNEKELEHLKVENERLANRITCQVVLPDDKLEEIKKECLEKVELAKGELLKQFAERLKKKLFDLGNIVNENDIDETLKEFIDAK